jgi:hypothetical protein
VIRVFMPVLVERIERTSLTIAVQCPVSSATTGARASAALAPTTK